MGNLCCRVWPWALLGGRARSRQPISVFEEIKKRWKEVAKPQEVLLIFNPFQAEKHWQIVCSKQPKQCRRDRSKEHPKCWSPFSGWKVCSQAIRDWVCWTQWKHIAASHSNHVCGFPPKNQAVLNQHTERFPACFCGKAGVVTAVWLRGRQEMMLQALDCHFLAVFCFVLKICALASQIKSTNRMLQKIIMTYFNELSFVHFFAPQVIVPWCFPVQHIYLNWARGCIWRRKGQWQRGGARFQQGNLWRTTALEYNQVKIATLFLDMNWSRRCLLLPVQFSSNPVLPHKVELLSLDSASVEIGSRNQMFLKIKEACACLSSSIQPFSSQYDGEKPHGAAHMHTNGLRLAA